MEHLLIKSTLGDTTVEFKQPINLEGKRCFIALKNLSLWNSWHNISDKFDNNKFDFMNETGVYTTHTIPNGNYTVDDLNSYFESAGVNAKLHINFAVSRFVLEVAKSCALDLSKSKLCEILGFMPANYIGTNTGAYIANISRGIDIIFVHCDLISDARFNEGHSDVLFCFTPKSAPGTLIDLPINEPIFHNVNVGQIRKIRLWLSDQNDNLIDLNDQMIVYSLLINYI